MYIPENMTAAYFFFDTYPGYFLQALPIALLIGGLWAFRLRKTALPLPERLRDWGSPAPLSCSSPFSGAASTAMIFCSMPWAP